MEVVADDGNALYEGQVQCSATLAIMRAVGYELNVQRTAGESQYRGFVPSRAAGCTMAAWGTTQASGRESHGCEANLVFERA